MQLLLTIYSTLWGFGVGWGSIFPILGGFIRILFSDVCHITPTIYLGDVVANKRNLLHNSKSDRSKRSNNSKNVLKQQKKNVYPWTLLVVDIACG